MARPPSRDWKPILERAFREGLSATQVAEQEGVADRTVSQAAERFGIKLRDGRETHIVRLPKKTGRPSSHDWDTILRKAVEDGLTYIDVAKATGVSRNGVKSAAAGRGIELAVDPQRAEAAGSRWRKLEISVADIEGEQWRPCPSWPGYEASTLGRVKSRHGLLSMTPGPSGYPMAAPSVGGRQHPAAIHRMVIEAFHGLQPDGMECRHLDGNRLNSRPDNLAWGTRLENQRDREAHGTTNRGEANAMCKITPEIALDIFRRANAGERPADIVASYGIDRFNVWAIRSGRTWSHVTGVKKNVDPKRAK